MDTTSRKRTNRPDKTHTTRSRKTAAKTVAKGTQDLPDLHLPDGVSDEWQRFYQAWVKTWRERRR
ncbi:hypothetical protein [Alicyclobacillus herbarius]|uniref:hypothetical protein n=1 Tax=Alicyclobacillus herbarius TaxID=122960 RepID=UPI0004201803|nr:hypothetical protein [Alicyclobacillus herbarius]